MSRQKPVLWDTRGVLTPRMVAGKRNGAAGGRKRSLNMTAEQRQAVSAKGGAAVVAKYGVAYFRYIRSCVGKKKAG